MMRLRTAYLIGSPSGPISSDGRITVPAGTGSMPGRTFSSSSWKDSLAVRPSSALILSGSRTPGSWMRIRSSPWRWMLGSRVPVSSMRRRTTSIA
jgi:hypothetical protein